ncbi:MFS transporter [Actinoplanes lobatus]|uniref:MFS family permease n=1 Tax=Actinoplanes lobatus TaxID=113568 RepID=A0A7W7MKG7_9ACTN|nr:MFS transporter [Actinoplanes lobatus]MBB4753498.1 MFS family permease [Actinoplanes lobatus]GGN91790.1 MFS transporter [Actinoplanes lobatus]GIE38031.1 MFS transporter [Actinoplanes lobatus]
MLTGPARKLVTAQLVTNIGNGAFGTCSALYFTQVLGFSPAALGLGLAAAGVAGVLAGVPAGHLADRFGARRVAVLLVALTGVAAAGYIVLDSYPAFVVIACAWALFGRGGYAARQALMAAVLSGQDLVQARARLRVVTNIGLAIGAGVGALALAADTPQAYRIVLALDAFSFFGSAVLLHRLPAAPPTAVERQPGEPRLAVLRDRPYATITLLNMVMSLHVPVLDVILPLWIVLHTGAPKPLTAALVVLNTVTVVLLQVRVTTGIDTVPTAVRATRTAALVLAGMCLFFAASDGRDAVVATVLLIVAAGLHVYGEMVQSSAGWVLAYELAPPDRQGQYQGFFNSGTAVSQMVAPAALTLLLIEGGRPGWLVLAAAFLAAGWATGPATARAHQYERSTP